MLPDAAGAACARVTFALWAGCRRASLARRVMCALLVATFAAALPLPIRAAESTAELPSIYQHSSTPSCTSADQERTPKSAACPHSADANQPANAATTGRERLVDHTATMRYSPLSGALLDAPGDPLNNPGAPTRLHIYDARAPALSSGIDPAAVSRMRGARLTVAPIPRWSRGFALSGSYLATSQTAHALFSSDAERRRLAQSWSVGADSLLLGRSMRVRGEYLRSGLDSARPISSQSRDDTAYDLGVAYRIPGADAGGKQDWRLELHHTRIGSDFWSPGNPSLAKGVGLWTANVSHTLHGVNMRFDVTRRRDNLRANADAPRTEDQLYRLHFRSAVRMLPETLVWLGRLVATLTLRSERIINSQSFAQHARGGRVDFDFGREPFSWRVSSGWDSISQDSEVTDAFSTFARSYAVAMTFTAARGFTVSPQYELKVTNGLGTVADTLSHSGIVAARLPLSRGRAALTFNARVERTSSAALPGGIEQGLVNAGVVWNVSDPHGRHPGVALNLTNGVQWMRGAVGDSGYSDWRVMAGVRIAYAGLQ